MADRPRLLDPRPCWLGHDGNRPANGLHLWFSWRSRWLLAAAIFFFAVAIAPASALKDSAAIGRSLSDEIFSDLVHVICFDLTEELSSGIGADGRSWQTGSGPAMATEAASRPAVLAALASLPENPCVWLFAVFPWIWSAITWHSRPARRRRVRRKRS